MRARPLPREINDRAFHVRHAMALEVHPERLRRLDLAAPTRGLRWSAALPPPPGRERIRAFRSLVLPGQFISHTSAAELWGLPLPITVRRDPSIHVTSIDPAAQMRRPGVIGHRVQPERAHVRQRWGMPTSSPATTWAECGSLLGIDALVALGDAIVTRPVCATTVEDLRRVLRERIGSRGAKRLRAALELIRPGAGSARETDVRLAIGRAGLPEPELQVPIVDEHGRVIGRADMAYPNARVIIEYEGDHHRTDERQWAIDIQRYREFQRLGWFVFRLTKADVRNDPRLRELARVLAARTGADAAA